MQIMDICSISHECIDDSTPNSPSRSKGTSNAFGHKQERTSVECCTGGLRPCSV
ncbi:hypothetical protein DPMN_187256 [Dreissena polymorpha]|uniref:Uncharacterized protein n=1 Tax=Dreissena polymorpha TaxID=45954 RepID=A0A9D4I8W2_DREPO|nr:hypothetical protein DPMN_187256 [Dreissena polymorpha]